MSTFVTVGNATQPFPRFLAAVGTLVDSLPPPVFIQSGSARFECQGAEVRPFVAMDEFERRVEQAQLVVMHAGAGSVIHAVRSGKVPVVMPRRARYGEHVDDHQAEFAGRLASAGLVVLCDESGDLARAVDAARELQRLRTSHRPPSPMLSLVAESLRRIAARAGR